MNSFTDIFIKRPVFATVLSLILLLVGFRAMFDLSVRQYPKIDASVVNISVEYPGADSQLMESYVTTPIENAISGVDGLDYITSSSTQGETRIVAHFQLGYDINAAVADINSQVSSVRWQLPTDIHDPVVQKDDPNAQPIMYISFTSNTMPPEKVTDYLLRVIQPQISTMPGVASASILGEREYAMRIWLNPFQMAAHDITLNDINNTLLSQNLQSPTGRISAALQEFNVTAATDVATEQQFNNLIINTKDTNHLIRIQDVGHAQLAAKQTRFSVIMDDQQAIPIAITAKSDANPLDISKEIHEAFPEIQKNLPEGIQAKIVYDASDSIKDSIHEVIKTILEATIFVILVVFLFLGSLRVLLIPTVTIPLSLIGVCGVMLALGYSINVLTLLAMVLAIGMVVDDAIVVSENIHRHIEKTKNAFKAALAGASEIKFAVLAMTFTLAAVYAPIGFMTGLTGSLFREFAFTLASTVIISGFIALTLSPMMCSKIMTVDVLSGKLATSIEKFTTKLHYGYVAILKRVLKIRLLIVGLLILVLGACVFLYMFTPQELAPQEDEGSIFAMINAPADANLHYTEKYTKQLESIYNNFPAMQDYGIINGFPNGVNSAVSFMVLTPWSKRKISVNQTLQMLFPKFWAIQGVQAFPANPSALPGTSSFMPIQFVLQTTGSYDDLNKAMHSLMTEVKKNPAIMNIDSDLKINRPQVHIEINRDKAGDLGVPISDIGNALNIALGEPTVGHFTMSGRSYDVIPELMAEYRNTPQTLNNLEVRTASGELVPLSNLVKLTEQIQPQSLNHFQQLRSATLSGSTYPGYTLGQALDYIKNAADKVLPKNIKTDYSDASRQYIQASGAMLITFIFALIFIYLVLAAQFESFRDPFIVMFSVPLSTLGALALLHFTGGTLNIYSEIGLVTLIGLISKHGILMVEFANQLQERGTPLREAIINAAGIRLRPILMTTFAMILGAVPLAMATGSGAISRSQMGYVIIGGMSVGTLFTLFVIPVMYTYLATKKTAITTETDQ